MINNVRLCHYDPETFKVLGFYDETEHREVPTPTVSVLISDIVTYNDLDHTHVTIENEEFVGTYQVVVAPTDEELRQQFKLQRQQALDTATVEYQGMVFDADEESQNRMMRPILALPDDVTTQLWVLHDNSVVYLTKPQFKEVLALAGQKQTDIWVQT